jgi:hypothetical protein
MTAAETMRADFQDFSDKAWLPKTESQVNQFIFERSLLWRKTALIQPLETVIALIDDGK